MSDQQSTRAALASAPAGAGEGASTSLVAAAQTALAFLESEYPLVGPQEGLSAKAALRAALAAVAAADEGREG